MNLLNKTTKKKQIKGELIHYEFDTKNTAVAGFCPDCDGIVSFNSYFQRYIYLNPECCFEADVNKERIWNNSSREKFLKLENENTI